MENDKCKWTVKAAEEWPIERLSATTAEPNEPASVGCLHLPKKQGTACWFWMLQKRKAQAPEFLEPDFFEPKSRPGASVEMKEIFDIDGIATQQARKIIMQLNEMITERNTLARRNKRLACQVQSLQRK